MTTKYNYSLEDKELLLNLALESLEKKLHTLRDLSSMGEIITDESFKREKYEGYVRKELALLVQIKFDGYLHLLYELSTYAKQTNIFCEFYGSIQNSLTAYLLGIVSNYEFISSGEFINFTPFTKEPTINVVCSSDRKYELIDFINHKYSNLIKNKDENIEFLEPLKINFVDLDIGVKTSLSKEEATSLGLKVHEVNINFSTEHSRLTKQNEIVLGFDSLGLGAVQINKILYERKENGIFKNFDDFCTRLNKEIFSNEQLQLIQKTME
jgi:DNA polymerase III alpha subunit